VHPLDITEQVGEHAWLAGTRTSHLAQKIGVDLLGCLFHDGLRVESAIY